MKMIKVYSREYSNTPIRFGSDLVVFKNGEAEVSEDLYKKVKEMNFPIYTKEDMPEYKTPNQIDADVTIEEMKKEYLAEIDRLNNIIKAKDQKIEQLNIEVKTWKDEYEKTMKVETSEQTKKTSKNKENTTENLSNELKEVKEDLEKMSFAELKELATEESIKGVDKFTEETQKADLINLIISSYSSK